MNINYNKGNGLVPVIIQDNVSLQVLMLGYMNEEAYLKTINENRVTFYSRSKQRLWTKGEDSQNYLEVVDTHIDCDNDTILIKVNPTGPTCHTGSRSCFKDLSSKGFVYKLEAIINKRIENNDQSSYTNQLFREGINKLAQKVGEEAVELVIEALGNNDVLFKNEAADLLYHYLILLSAKGSTFDEIEAELQKRNEKS